MKLCVVIALLLAGCSPGPQRPVAIDTVHDACHQCRMIISDVRFAGQIVAPGEQPRLFDDIACLRNYLRTHAPIARATVFVADHRTGEWIEATRAVFTRGPMVGTPMASGLMAHASIASRDADPAAAGAEDVPASAILRAPGTGKALE